MKKDRKLCKRKDCMIRTCSRHYCHIPKWYNLPIVWTDFVEEEDCSLYRSKDKWEDLFMDYYNEDEDDIL